MERDEALEIALKRGAIEASIYDTLYEFSDDIPLFIEYAKLTGGPILECACGTGRIAIPLAREGFRVVGIDVSEEMLRTAKMKIAREPTEVQERIEIVKADMRDFQLDERFGLCLIPFASFIQVLTVEDQRKTLTRIHEHLSPGGRLILDSFNPDLTRPQGLLRLESLKRVGEDTLIRFTVQYFDVPNQVTFGWVIYDTVKSDSSLSRQSVPFRARYFFAAEMKALLEDLGYMVEDVFGDFKKMPYQQQSPRIIVIGRRE